VGVGFGSSSRGRENGFVARRDCFFGKARAAGRRPATVSSHQVLRMPARPLLRGYHVLQVPLLCLRRG
jgi:hypothetical protein